MIEGDAINFAGAGGPGLEVASWRRQTNESERRDESIAVWKRSRQFEDDDENSETRGGCTDDANMTGEASVRTA